MSRAVPKIVIVGWDIGGAHLKFAALGTNGELLATAQLPCALWRGLPVLQNALQQAVEDYGLNNARHVCTMTGELVDLFESRAQGVQQIAASTSQILGTQTRFYAAGQGWLAANEAGAAARLIASTNWHASATWLAQMVPDALLVDIGSTTTDIIPIRGGKVALQSLTDAERMRDGSLLYTGVVRTPLMALANQWSFEGAQVNVAAEYFATMADVYRLLGELDARDDMADTADGKGKSILESARRLARMVGHDVEDKSLAVWRELANTCKTMHMQQINAAIARHLQPNTLILGAGAGAFLVKQIAEKLIADKKAQAYEPVCMWLPGIPDNLLCLPAYAVASLYLKNA